MEESEILEQIKKIAGEKAEDYNKRFIESQERIAVEQAKRWQAENPFDETKESLEEYNKRLVAFVEDFIKQTPDEMLFNMRVLAQGLGTIFNMLSAVNTNLLDVVDILKVTNAQKLQAWANKEVKRLKEMQDKHAESENK